MDLSGAGPILKAVACRAMPDRFSDASPDVPSEDELRARAAFNAQQSAGGIGAAVARFDRADDGHYWECIVSDGNEWHFIRVLGVDLGSTPDLTSEDIERGVETYAATLPESYRLGALLNANPLHVDSSGSLTD
jgi:hypothetical protein